MSDKFSRYDYCSDHSGWGSSTQPCKVCGKLTPPNDFPPIPEGLTFNEKLAWGAEEINRRVKERVENS